MRHLLLSLAILALAPARAAAQQPVPATPAPLPSAPQGQNVIRGAIQVCDCARGEHRVQMQAGRRYAISATSGSFDPLLRVLRAGSEQVLAEDDDSGGGVSPRLAFTPPASGEYLIRVNSALPGGAGEYALRVEPMPPLPALMVRPTRTEQAQWQVFEANLASGGSEFGRRYHDYAVSLAAGQSAMIHVQGRQGLDTMVQVFPLAERGNRPLAENDDGGGGADPFLVFAPAQAGTYVVRVIGLDESSVGTYRMRISY